MKLKPINYSDFCESKDIKDFNKDQSVQNCIYIAKQSEKLNLIPPSNQFLKNLVPVNCKTNDFYIASIKNALCLKNQIIIYKEKYILPDAFRHYDYTVKHSSLSKDADSNTFFTKQKIDEAKCLQGDFIFLSGEVSEGYGHFLLEVVSRLWIINYMELSDYKFVMNPSDKHSWQLDILEALGISRKQIIYLDQPTKFETLHIPVQSFVLRNYTSSLVYDVWGKIGDYYDEGRGVDRVYISRSKLNNNRRRLINETAVEDVFAAHGFKIIHPQELSFREQVNYFRNARIIAGPSGSAMYNCVFSKKTVKKLILTNTNFIKLSDILINTSTGGNITYFIGDLIERGKPGNRTNWFVNTKQLEKFLKRFLSNSPRDI
jgi:capsular polysaccharide biosynthesis protein